MKSFQIHIAEKFLKLFHRLHFCREVNQKASIKPVLLIQCHEQCTYDTGFQLENPDTDHGLLLEEIAMTKQTAACWEDSHCCN